MGMYDNSAYEDNLSFIADDFGLGKEGGEQFDVMTKLDALRIRFIHAVKSKNNKAAIIMYSTLGASTKKLKESAPNSKEYADRIAMLKKMKDMLLKYGIVKEKSKDENENMQGEKVSNPSDMVSSDNGKAKDFSFEGVKGFFINNKKILLIVGVGVVCYFAYRYFKSSSNLSE